MNLYSLAPDALTAAFPSRMLGSHSELALTCCLFCMRLCVCLCAYVSVCACAWFLDSLAALSKGAVITRKQHLKALLDGSDRSNI